MYIALTNVVFINRERFSEIQGKGDMLKNTKSFLSIIYIRCLMWWAKVGGRVVGIIDERV